MKDTTKRAKYIIFFKNKRWLCNQIGITLPTLNKRLEGQAKWKAAEAAVIEQMYNVSRRLDDVSA